MSDTPTPQHLQATPLIDAGHPDVQAFAREHAQGAGERARAVALVHAVRDGFRYDPYRIDLCVPKATLLTAVARAAGIPARLGFADVRNHMSTERMRETMKTDLFIWHGYTELWLEGAWRKATPAFNIELCEKFGLLPLDFDGVHDSIYHAFDKAGNRHMEYVNERGAFDDLPLDRLVADFHATYPGWVPGDVLQSELKQGDFLADVARETGRA
jgi:transglutaminase-like putative cysteine protease